MNRTHDDTKLVGIEASVGLKQFDHYGAPAGILAPVESVFSIYAEDLPEGSIHFCMTHPITAEKIKKGLIGMASLIP
jgi:hypothetical protein